MTNAEIQSTATEIAVEFRQLLGFVEARNDTPNFDYIRIKTNFETVSAGLAVRLATLQTSAQGADALLRDKCQQLAKLLRAIVEDVRQELIGSSPATSDAHAQQAAYASASANLAARLPRSTAEAVTLIKSVLAAAQGVPTPTSSPNLSSATEIHHRPLPIPNSSSSSHRSYASPTTSVQQSSLRASASSPSARPLTLARTNSSPNSLRDSARAMSLSSPAATISATSYAPSSPTDRSTSNQPSPLASLSHIDSQPLPLPGIQRSTSVPHHSPSPQPLNLSGAIPSSLPTTPSRSSVGPRRAPSPAVPLLVDGTTSHPHHPPSHVTAMKLLIDKRKDPALTKLVRCVIDSISWISDLSLKSKMLAFYVGSAMGKVDVCRNCANDFTQLREKYANEPCPLGEISYGYARHRSLLFKYLADSMSLPVRIHSHASTLRAPDAAGDAKEAPAQTHAAVISVVEVYLGTEKKWCVVDLIKEIGELYDEDSPRAQEYKQTSMEWEDEQPPSKSETKPTTSPSSTSPTPSPSSSEIINPSQANNGATANGETAESMPPPPSKPPAKPRPRAGTTGGGGLPARPHRHSTHAPTQGPSPPALGKSSAKPGAAQATSGGRVLRLPVESAEIILNERIGKGTFGDVYRCRISGYTCAVKIVNIKSMSEAALKMMHNEIYFLETLSHENIIRFLGHEEIPKREIKIFMEFMPLTLAGIIQKRNTTGHHFNKKDLIKIAKGMAEAISYLHHRKIIHRDIKSSNVLLEIESTLDRVQEVRLCDFGVSKATDTAIAITFTGTNLWVAPEVFDVQFGAATSYDEKCDIWSFGMVLVELVTLNAPYYGISTQEATQSISYDYCFTKKDIRNGIPPSLEVNPHIDESISHLIYSCLKKSPSERASANDVLSIINNL